MQNIKRMADALLLDLINKVSKGLSIKKDNFDLMMEAYKKVYGEEINSRKLEKEQKKILRDLYNKAADSIKDYCQECLRIKGRLIE